MTLHTDDVLMIERPFTVAVHKSGASERFFSVVQVLGLAALLMFGVLAFGAVEVWSYSILQAGALMLLVLWAIRQVKDGRLNLRVNPLYLPCAMFAVVVILQLVLGLSAYSYPTTVEAMKYVAYAVIIFVTVQTIQMEADWKLFTLAMVCFGFALALFSLIQDFTFNGSLYWLRKPQFAGGVFGPYVNRNHYAGLMSMLAMLPLALCFYRGFHPPQRFMLGSAAALMGGTIFFSGSRGGMVAFVTGLIFFGAFMFVTGRRRSLHWGMAAVVLATVVFLFWVDSSKALDRWTKTELREEIAGGRWDITKDSLKMYTQKPVIGWGLGTFPAIYPQFRSFHTEFFINEAHNDYAQLLVETGALGGIAMVWFLFLVYRSCLRSVRQGGAPFQQLTQIAALSGCTALLVHSFVDFNLHVPANAAVFFCWCAICCIPLKPKHVPIST